MNGLEIAFQLANLVDMSQTIYMSQHPQQFEEAQTYFIQGRHPSVRSAVWFKVGEGAIHYAVSEALRNHPQAQMVWQSTTLTFQVGTDISNYRIGLGFSF